MSDTVLITGASSGFGEACAERFAAQGCPLVLFARRIDRLERLRNQLQQRHGTELVVHIAQVDVTDETSVTTALSQLPDAVSGIDVLVNNAGLALGVEPAHHTDFSDWEAMVNTNITGLLRLTHKLLPGMVERNHGHVINIGSTAGSWPYPGANVYGASKAFVQNFSQNLRADLLGSQVRVTVVNPGMAQTEFSDVRFRQDTARAGKVYENTRPLSAEDVAEIIHWVTQLPPHVNINSLEVMPVSQAWAGLAVHRGN